MGEATRTPLDEEEALTSLDMRCICGHSSKLHEGWPIPDGPCTRTPWPRLGCDCRRWVPDDQSMMQDAFINCGILCQCCGIGTPLAIATPPDTSLPSNLYDELCLDCAREAFGMPYGWWDELLDVGVNAHSCPVQAEGPYLWEMGLERVGGIW